jgi:hypothetical protein
MICLKTESAIEDDEVQQCDACGITVSNDACRAESGGRGRNLADLTRWFGCLHAHTHTHTHKHKHRALIVPQVHISCYGNDPPECEEVAEDDEDGNRRNCSD